MKKLILVLIFTLTILSCGQYQKVLNSNDPHKMYLLGTELYKKGKYPKAERLFALAENAYIGKPQYERLKFMRAMSLYHMRQYMSAGYEFRQFVNLFPNSSKNDEAYFYIIKCYQKLTPDYTRDLQYAEKTLEESERFFELYPQSKYIPQVKEISKEAFHKLQRKEFAHGKLYYDLGYYKSAVIALDNFLSDYPGTVFKEDALYYRFLAAAQLALNSVESKKAERTETALHYFEIFKNRFPQSKYLKTAENYYKKLKKQSQL